MVVLLPPFSVPDKRYAYEEIRTFARSVHDTDSVSSYGFTFHALLSDTVLFEDSMPLKPLPLVPVSKAVSTFDVLSKRLAKRRAGTIVRLDELPHINGTRQVREEFLKVSQEFCSLATDPSVYSAALKADNPLKACFDVWIEECRVFSGRTLFDLMKSGIEMKPEFDVFRHDDSFHEYICTRRETIEEYLNRVEDTFIALNPLADGNAFQYFLMAVIPDCFKSTMQTVMPSINKKLSVSETKYFILDHEHAFNAERAAWYSPSKTKSEVDQEAETHSEESPPSPTEPEISSDWFPCSAEN